MVRYLCRGVSSMKRVQMMNGWLCRSKRVRLQAEEVEIMALFVGSQQQHPWWVEVQSDDRCSVMGTEVSNDATCNAAAQQTDFSCSNGLGKISTYRKLSTWTTLAIVRDNNISSKFISYPMQRFSTE